MGVVPAVGTAKGDVSLYPAQNKLQLEGFRVGHDQSEIARRTAIALDAIKQAFEAGDDSVALFISHHCHEIEEPYWHEHNGTANPTSQQIIDLLVLSDHLDNQDDEGIRRFDFTLPGDATNYVIAVYFTDDGQVDDITMES